VVGDLPGGSYALRAGTEGDNPPVEVVRLSNNIFADFAGTMTRRFVNTYGKVVLDTFVLDNNLYYNGGTPLQGYFTGGSLNPVADARAVYGNPATAEDHSNLVLPVWDRQKGAFLSGSATIGQEFVRLVRTYGAIGPQSAARDAARPDQMPADDILGRRRDARPDIGAYEFQAPARRRE
jgi:hypothetical protein